MTTANNTHPKISVIVAVYNAEPYFDAFMESVLGQTFHDFEVVLIDDGAKDRSGEMCDEYAARDSRVRVYHKPNGGVASARQMGIEKACGDFCIHADPDDTVAPNFLEALYNEAIATEANMVICDYYKCTRKEQKLLSQRPTSLSPKQIIDDLLCDKIHGSLCNKLVRTNLYRKHGITFLEGLNYCEDLLVCVKLLLHDIKVSYLAQGLYFYNMYQNAGSITHNLSRKVLDQRLMLVSTLYNIIPQEDNIRGKSHIVSVAAFLSLKRALLTDKEFVEIFGKYRRDMWRANYKLTRRIALILAASGHQRIARLFIKFKKRK
jgi:glycosyltransferase involved in cell wall biosynthesis